MAGYRNSFEARCARDLGAAYQYESVKLPYTINHNYLPDFVDPVAMRIVEIKGYLDSTDRQKLIAVKAAHPGYSLEIWFQNPNLTISKASKTEYWQWAEKHGFAWRKGPNK
jgi:hypothetical protein